MIFMFRVVLNCSSDFGTMCTAIIVPADLKSVEISFEEIFVVNKPIELSSSSSNMR